MKANFFSLKRPPAAMETRTFTEPLQDGFEIILTLRAVSDFNEDMQINEKTREYVTAYVDTGTALPIAGESLMLTTSLCHVIASLEVLQVADTQEDRYTLLDWATCSVTTPNLFRKVSDFAFELRDKAEHGLKNEPAESTA